MATKKQGFIQTYFGKPISTVKQMVLSVPKFIPFTKNKKIELDKWSKTVREKLKNPALSNYSLGERFFQERKFGDAITRFKIACYMKKDYAQSYFLLAKSYLAISKNQKAILNFEKAKNYGFSSEDANYFYAIYLDNNLKLQPNNQLRKAYFDCISLILDEYYINNFNYLGIEKICDSFKSHNKKKSTKIIELGCGNGMLGKAIKTSSPAVSLTGLDYATDMIQKAKLLKSVEYENDIEVIDLKNTPSEQNTEISVYDYLIKTDLKNYNQTENKYDAVLARGIFNYIDDYSNIIQNISKLLNNNGLFILYLRKPLDEEDYQYIRDNFSFPFYSNFVIHEIPKFIKYCEKQSMKLISQQDFTLEIKYSATILVFNKA